MPDNEVNRFLSNGVCLQFRGEKILPEKPALPPESWLPPQRNG